MKIISSFLIFFFLILYGSEWIYGEETVDFSVMDKMEWKEVDDILQSSEEWKEGVEHFFGGETFGFRDMVMEILTGKKPFEFSTIFKTIIAAVFSEVVQTKNNLIIILLLIIVTGVFQNMAGAFQNHQIADMTRLIMYLLLFVSVLTSFSLALEMVKDTMKTLSSFLSALAPAYFLSVAASGSASSAAAFYSLSIFLISAIELCILYIILPLVQIFAVLAFVNKLSKEDMLAYLLDTIKTVIEYILKTMIGLSVSIGVIQSMIAPVLDSFKNTMLSKAVSAIPGIGNMTGGLTEVFFGSAVVIKNGIGAVSLIVVLYLCLVPIGKLIAVILMYKGATAVAGMVSGKEYADGLAKVSEGGEMLLKAFVTGMVLFMAIIAMVASTTNRGY
ncbi:hypothetical protein D7X25_15535 [bacterium 1XD42-8]|nr:hypothetical protein D7X25_15535 [bacterium 1XD42-8]